MRRSATMRQPTVATAMTATAPVSHGKGSAHYTAHDGDPTLHRPGRLRTHAGRDDKRGGSVKPLDQKQDQHGAQSREEPGCHTTGYPNPQPDHNEHEPD